MTKQLNIVAVSPALNTKDSYIVVLQEVEGPRTLPIIIGNTEANAIVMHMNGRVPSRPLTHDLMASLIAEAKTTVENVCIREVKEGVFISAINILNLDGTTASVDSRTSDALALSVRINCPIYAESAVLDECGVNEDVKTSSPVILPQKPTENLKELLDKALEREDYEEAAKLRDRLAAADNEK